MAAAAAAAAAALRAATAASCPSAELQALVARRLAAVDQLVSNAPSMDELQSLPIEAAEHLRSKLLLMRKLAGLLQRVGQQPPPTIDSCAVECMLHTYREPRALNTAHAPICFLTG